MLDDNLLACSEISIHAPAWGATQFSREDWKRRYYFNPRSRVGSDPCACTLTCARYNFNPRSRVGSDLRLLQTLNPLRDFNPRSRVGSDRQLWLRLHGAENFNPRSRVGSDGLNTTNTQRNMIFQSTLPRGERRVTATACSDRLAISIHAPAWGATMIRTLLVHWSIISIHAPAWGATRSRK